MMEVDFGCNKGRSQKGSGDVGPDGGPEAGMALWMGTGPSYFLKLHVLVSISHQSESNSKGPGRFPAYDQHVDVCLI